MNKFKGLLVERGPGISHFTGEASGYYKQIEPTFKRNGAWQYTDRNGFSWYEVDGLAFVAKHLNLASERDYRQFKVKEVVYRNIHLTSIQIEAIRVIVSSRLYGWKKYSEILGAHERISTEKEAHRMYLKVVRRLGKLGKIYRPNPLPLP